MSLSDSLGPDIIKLAEEKGIGSVSIHKILKQSGRDVSRTTVTRILRDHRNKLGKPRPKGSNIPDFDIGSLPSSEATLDEILLNRKKESKRVAHAKESRRLIPIEVKADGPIGILHMGDPHVDDPGADIFAIERDIDLCNSVDGLFAANVGDLQNNWIGRLAPLWKKQGATAEEAWLLVEWVVKSNKWLYLIGGNHDEWTNAPSKSKGDPIKWMMDQGKGGLYEPHGARMVLNFPNERKIRINARHDFRGHSMWNPAHGVAKAAQMGWRDHILTCGHLHISGYQMLKDPASGLISHAMRVASYKKYDEYAHTLGLPDQNVSPSVVTIIDPQFSDDDPRLITVFHSSEEGAEFLKWKTSKK